MTKTFNPWSHKIKFLQAVNKAISAGKQEFYIYRTVDGAVKKYTVQLMGINLETGQLNVQYERDGAYTSFCENTSEQDLTLISQRARQLEQQILKNRG